MAPRLAVTVGDPRGIGPEIVEAVFATPPGGAEFVIVGPADSVRLPDLEHVDAGEWADGGAAGAGRVAARAIELATEMALRGEVDGIVTAPIEKRALQLAGYESRGHTEMLANLAGVPDVAMMLASEHLRVVLVTTHIPLRDVPDALTTDLIVRIGRVTLRGLQEQFGLSSPRLALCALNPHAGERGLFGSEDQDIIAPAAEALGASGPHPADTVFVRCMRGEFDAVLCPYHDVGMTAIKVAAFGRAVNVTLGLPFIRTSPDHGTAFDIAGKGLADPSSMRAAVHLAIQLAERAILRRL